MGDTLATTKPPAATTNVAPSAGTASKVTVDPSLAPLVSAAKAGRPSNICRGDIQEIQHRVSSESGLPSMQTRLGLGLGQRSGQGRRHFPLVGSGHVSCSPSLLITPTEKEKGTATAPAFPSPNTPRLPSSGKLCRHGSCTKYKQSGCYGYCLTHIMLYGPPSAHGNLARLATINAPVVHRGKDTLATTKPPAATTNMAPSAGTASKVTVDPNLAFLLSAAKADPTVWSSPSFTLAMNAVVAQTAPKLPA